MKRRLLLSTLVVLTLLTGGYWSVSRSATVCAKNILQLKMGMTEEELVSLLGPSLDMKLYRLDRAETYQPGSSDYATLRYQLHAPDRPDWASFRVLHPANDAMGFASLPTPNRVFVGNDMAVFVALSPENKLEKALTYPIVKEPPQTLAALEYYFDKLVGNYRPPSNAPLPLVPPPPPPLPLDDPTQS